MASFILISDTDTKMAISIITKLIAFIVVGLCLFSIVAYGITLSDKEQEFWLNNFEWNSTLPDYRLKKTNIITLGHSHNVAINQQLFKGNLRHFYTGAQTKKDSIRILKNLKHTLENNKIILMPVSLTMLYEEPQNQPLLIPTRRTNIDFYYSLKSAFSYIRHIGTIFELKQLSLRRKKKGCLNEQEEIIKQCFLRKLDLKIQAYSKWMNKDQLSNNLHYLERLLKISSQMDSCFVFYESPVSQIYKDKIQKHTLGLTNWKEKIRSFVTTNESQYCVIFLDNLWSKNETKNLSYYKNTDHLNTHGSTIFTTRLKATLRKKIQNEKTFHSVLGNLDELLN